MASISVVGQNIPIDFEEAGNGADWTWTTFENDTNPPLEIIANPDADGINTSAFVAKFTALQTGQPFAGCESMHGADIGTFTIDEASSTIRIMVWKPVISDVGIKLVAVDNSSLGEIKIANTLVNQWEQLTFDFSSHIGMTYDQIVIFPDFAGRSSDNIVYFDNIYGDMVTSTSVADLAANETKVFPNPSSDYINIQSSAFLESYKIYSSFGQLVVDQTVVGDESRINISNLQSGMYILETTSAGKTAVNRFIKQ